MTKKLYTCILCLVLLFSTLITTSFAWFMWSHATMIDEFDGALYTGYFYTGSGTKEDPYVITRPVHYLNMTDLIYYNSKFSNCYYKVGFDFDNDGSDEVFNYSDTGELLTGYSTWLNMAAYTVLPIGSAGTAFNGGFDGSGLIVGNLNIVADGKQDSGVFGYVTKAAEVKDIYFDNVNITAIVGNEKPDASHIVHSSAYSGYLAGHAESAKTFNNVYINHCSMTSTTLDLFLQNNWGYFGQCDDAATIADFLARTSGDSGFGNSIDFKSIGQRVVFMSRYMKTHSQGYYSEVYNLVLNKQNIDASGTWYAYIRNGTYLPVNVQNDITSTFYNGKTPEQPTDGNAGYICGIETNKSSSFTIANRKFSADNGDGDIRYSLNGSSSYDPNKLALYTFSTNGTRYRIVDEAYNGTSYQLTGFTPKAANAFNFHQYNNVRTKLNDLFADSGASYLKFGTGNEYSQTANLKKQTATDVKLCGVDYENYDLIKYAINFTATESGYVAGIFKPNNTGNTRFCDLVEVTRHNGRISSINTDCKLIISIFEDASGKIKYVYENNSTKTEPGFNAATQVEKYNRSWWETSVTASEKNALYYIELPLMPGDYAFTRVGSKWNSYQFCYLDLGISGGNSGQAAGVDDFKSVEYRSAPDTVDASICLLSYEQPKNSTLTVSTAFDSATNTYTVNLTCSETVEVHITLLDDKYKIYFNGQELSIIETKIFIV